MFVTYPQSGNGQRQVMSDHRRNMFLSFHLVVVSRDPRARGLSLSSQAIGSRNNMLLRSDGCFPSPALPPRRKGHDMRCARPWAVLGAQLLHCGAALTRVRVYTPQTGGGQPVNPRTWSLRDFPESLAEGIYIPLCASGPQPRQFGGVCLTYEQRHHAFIHTLIHNVPDKRNEYSSPGGRRPQRAECSLHTRSLATANVRSCPTTVETCSCRFILLSFRETRAREVSLSLLKPSARETICCFVPMVAFLLAVLEQRDQASGGSSEWCYGLDVVCR